MIKKTLIYIKKTLQAKRCKHILNQLEKILIKNKFDIPVFIVGYNNGIHILNTVKQLNKLNIFPIIFNNASTDIETINILNEINQKKSAHIINSKYNFGHLIGFLDSIYTQMPEVFAYTDPDLQFNPELPSDFLQTLANLSVEYKTFKAGFSLDLMPKEEVVTNTQIIKKHKPFSYQKQFGVRDWEEKFWRFKLDHKTYEIYAADIDTTFAVYRKSNFKGNFFDAIRVGREFKAVHLPWFPKINLMSDEQIKKYLIKNKSSTWINVNHD
jgi:hypothetical protein